MTEVLEELRGCEQSIDLLNILPSDLLSDICHDVMLYLQLKIPAVNMLNLKEKFGQCNISMKDEDVQSIINVLIHIYRSASKHKVPSTEFHQQLTASFKFSQSCVECLARSWKDNEECLQNEQISSLFEVGKLVDMQWKLGVAVSSDSCKNLNSTFVAMTVKVADSSGKLTTHAFEMTVPQFKNLAKQLQDMARSMEMV